MTKKEDTYSYKGWLNSDRFIKRAFAVLGYGIMGQLFIMFIFLVLGFIFGVLDAVFGV